MDWTEPKSPKLDVSNYNHCFCDTPLGKMIIEWESWKFNTGYTIQIVDGDWLRCEDTLEDAKIFSENYLKEKSKQLIEYLK